MKDGATRQRSNANTVSSLFHKDSHSFPIQTSDVTEDLVNRRLRMLDHFIMREFFFGFAKDLEFPANVVAAGANTKQKERRERASAEEPKVCKGLRTRQPSLKDWSTKIYLACHGRPEYATHAAGRGKLESSK